MSDIYFYLVCHFSIKKKKRVQQGPETQTPGCTHAQTFYHSPTHPSTWRCIHHSVTVFLSLLSVAPFTQLTKL